MSKSYDKVNETLKNNPPKNQPPMKQMPVDPIAAVTQHRASVTIDTEMELKAVLGNKNDPVDMPEELMELKAVLGNKNDPVDMPEELDENKHKSLGL